MLKPCENPPIRPDSAANAPQVASVREFVGDWWIAHTKSRNEKAFAWDLHRKRIGYFLPMVEKVTFSGGRTRRNLAPVFGGYVFFCGTQEDRYNALCTNRLCNVIPVQDRARLLTELSQIELALNASAELELFPQLAIGRQVRISAGPMEGVEGIIIDRIERGAGAKATVVLNVGVLGQGAAISVAPSLLVVADGSASHDQQETQRAKARPTCIIVERSGRNAICSSK